MTWPINRGTDPVSRRVYALIFNGVTRASSTADDEQDWIRLSERERIAAAVYNELMSGGVAMSCVDGLEQLRRAAEILARRDA
jgi:hypothetical protein